MVSELFRKVTSATLCMQIQDMMNYSIFICLFEFGKCEEEAKKAKKKTFGKKLKNRGHKL